MLRTNKKVVREGDVLVEEGKSVYMGISVLDRYRNPSSSCASMFADTPKQQPSDDEQILNSLGIIIKHFKIDTSPKNPIKKLALLITDTKRNPTSSHLQFSLIFHNAEIAKKYTELFKECNYNLVNGAEGGCHFKDYTTLKNACEKLVKDGILEEIHVKKYLQDINKYLQEKNLIESGLASPKLR